MMSLHNQQVTLFNKMCTGIQQQLGYSFIKHIANTAGIFRHPQYQMDMVRLGIGLYGVDSANGKEIQLQTVATLKTTIAQIRKVKAGETIGYNKRGILTKDSTIATIRIGYADGFSRKLSNGVGTVVVNNQLAKVIGNVCMDMAMIDITHINNVKEGDVVEVFGNNLPIQEVAKNCETIAYEIMTSISQRVKRVYIEE
ncbi:MAG: alanine racemase [Chitinophagaceae bacterium]